MLGQPSRTAETVYLCRASFAAWHLVAMERLRQRAGQRVMIVLRQAVPVCRSAVGKMLLSALSDSQVLHIARHANALEEDANQRVSTRELLDEMALIRARGWAMTVD